VYAAEAFAEEFVVGILDGHGWIITAALAIDTGRFSTQLAAVQPTKL
jgi:hypothetical protein